MHRLDSGPEPSVFVARNVERNLQIPVQVLDLFTFLLLEDGILVGFVLLLRVILLRSCANVGVQPSALSLLRHCTGVWHGATAKEYVAGPIVMDDLLVHSASLL